MGRGYSEYDEDEDLDGEEEEGGEPDALADFDEEQRALVEGVLQKQKAQALAEQRAQLRESFQAQGFDLSEDGRPLIADPAKVTGYLSALQPAPSAPKPAPETAQGDDDPRPDMYVDPDGYTAWVERRAELRAQAIVEKKLAELQPRLDQQEAFRLSVSERQALDRVQALIPGSNFSQLGAPEYAEAFQREFLKLLRDAPPQFWGNDESLEMLAAATIPKVLPRKPQERGAGGRWASAQSRDAQLYRDSHQAHPDGTRAPRNPQPTEAEAQAMRRYNMTADEYVALSGPNASLKDYRAAQKKAKK